MFSFPVCCVICGDPFFELRPELPLRFCKNICVYLRLCKIGDLCISLIFVI